MANDKEYIKPKNTEDPVEKKMAEPEYPWVSGSSDRNGKFNITYADPDNPGKSFVQEFNYDGSSEQHVTLEGEDMGVRSVAAHHVRNAASKGTSNESGSHSDDSAGKTGRKTIWAENGTTSGGDSLGGTGGRRVRIAAAGSSENVVGSSGDEYQYTSGDRTVRHDGNQFHHNDQDFMSTTGGTKYEVVKDGEWGLHVQSGNFDIQVDSGQGRMFVQQPLLIESPTKITFKVGGSTITMEPGQITLVSDRIDHNP